MIQIEQLGMRKHTKASEIYVDVIFRYENNVEVNTSVPIQYRRTGTDIDIHDNDAISSYLSKVYNVMHPDNWKNWKQEQIKFWELKQNSKITKAIF